MFIPVVIIALAVAATAPGQRPSTEILRSVAACGVSTTNISQRWDRTLQETVVDVPQKSFREGDLYCLAKASEKLLVDFQFGSPRLQVEYERAQAITPRALEAVQRSRAESRKWLKQNGLLEGALRIRAEKGSLNEQAKKMEAYCGFGPGTILQVRGSSVLIVAPPNVTYNQLHKLLAVMDVVVPEHTVGLVSQELR
jgi:hypothetical protein